MTSIRCFSTGIALALLLGSVGQAETLAEIQSRPGFRKEVPDIISEVGKPMQLQCKLPAGLGDVKQLRFRWRQIMEPDFVGTLTSLEAPRDWFRDYGQRISGYLRPPVTGDYTFWIASDDGSRLILSPDTDPGHAETIAEVSGWAGFRDFDAQPNQRSQPIRLQAGQAYYIEVLHKAMLGGDHVSVAWAKTGWDRRIIEGKHLSEYTPEHDRPVGSITREVWRWVRGGKVEDLLSSPRLRGVNLSSADQPTATFTPSVIGRYDFEVTVPDGEKPVAPQRVYSYATEALRNGDLETGGADGPTGWRTWASDPQAVALRWEPSGGLDNSRCLSISLADADKPVHGFWGQTVQLAPYTSYLVRGYAKCEGLHTTSLRGAVQVAGFETGPGPQGSVQDWTPFESKRATGPNGMLDITLWLGSYREITSGKVYFDNLTVERRDDVETFEGEHFILHMPIDVLALTTRDSIERIVADTDRACVALVELTGNDDGGDKQSAQWVKGWSGGCAGNPLTWGEYCESIQRDWPKEDFCPEIFLHELGHNYTRSGEADAALALYYAQEVCDFVSAEAHETRGADARCRFDASWQQYPGDDCWRVWRTILIRDKIGWEPFRRAYRHLASQPPAERPKSDWEKFRLFHDKLAEYSGFDVWSFYSQDDLAAVRWALEPHPTAMMLPSPASVPPTQRSTMLIQTRWESADVGWNRPQYKPKSSSEKTYFHAIWAHAPSEYTYQLGGKWQTFIGYYGLEVGNERGSVTFVVKGDGKELFHSPLVRGECEAHGFSVDVSGVQALQLIVEDAGDGKTNDAGIWFDPKLER